MGSFFCGKCLEIEKYTIWKPWNVASAYVNCTEVMKALNRVSQGYQYQPLLAVLITAPRLSTSVKRILCA